MFPDVVVSWSDAWLPRHLVERRAPLPNPGTQESFAGTLIRLDIAGFTSRAERIHGRDQAVSEELARTVEEAFGPIFFAVDRHGGSVAGLEGDAVLALFRGAGHAERARRALTDVLAVRPGLHAAIASAEVRALHLAGGEQRAEVLHGPALDALEHVEAEVPASAFVAGSASELPTGPMQCPPQSELVKFVPPVLRDGRGESAGHRRVVSAFVEVPLSMAVTAYRILAEEAAAHAVTLLKVRAERHAMVAMAVTGAPVAHENDALRALAWAISVRERLQDEGAIRCRVGAAEGPVLALVIGDASRSSWDVIGDTVNVAYRLMEQARAGEIIATATLCERGREIVAGASESVVLRGKSRPVAVRRVERLAANAAPIGDPHFGRMRELAALAAALSEPGAVAIVGAAGLGKRRLWQELAAREPNWRTMRATCRDYGTVRPLSPFVGLIRRLAGDAPSRMAVQATLADLPGMNDRATAILLALLGSGAPQVAATMSALRQLLGGLGAAGPTLLVVEDWQWADADTRAFVETLQPDLQRLGVRMVLTARPRTALPDGITTIALSPLDRAAARRLVESVSRENPISSEVTERVLDRGAGNPRDLVALAEAASRGVDTLPDSIEAWYAAQIDDLPEPAREVLDRAAVLGRNVEIALLRRLAADVPRVEEGLRALTESRLLVGESSRLSFDRETIREIVYMRMTSARRRMLHGRAGKVLRARAEAGAAVSPEVVAWHLSRSDTPADALPELMDASRRALAHGRPRLALAHAEQAVRLARQYAADRVADTQRALGDAMLRLGRTDLAMEAFRAAGDQQVTAKVAAALVAAGLGREALLAVEGDSSALGAAVRARALSMLGDPRAADAHVAALQAAGSVEERSRALRFYGADLARADRHMEAVGVLEEAVRVARQARDAAGRAESLDLLGGSLAVIGEFRTALSYHREALVFREANTEPQGVASTLRWLGRVESQLGDHGAALGHLLAARGILRDAGLESRLGRVEVSLAEVRWRRGESEHARIHLLRAGDLVGRARATHRLLGALVARDTPDGRAAAAEAIDATNADRWRAGSALAGALLAHAERDEVAMEAALADVEACRHVEFVRIIEGMVAH